MLPPNSLKTPPASERRAPPPIYITRRTRPQINAEEGQSWAISYSDLLMVLMSFFVLFFSFDDAKKTNLITQIALDLQSKVDHKSITVEKKVGANNTSHGAGKGGSQGGGGAAVSTSSAARGSGGGVAGSSGVGEGAGSPGQSAIAGNGEGPGTTAGAAAKGAATSSAGSGAGSSDGSGGNGTATGLNVDEIITNLANTSLSSKKIPDEDGLIIALSDNVFAPRQIELNSDGLREMQQALAAIWPYRDAIEIIIIGHADNAQLTRPGKYLSSNYDLSSLRATRSMPLVEAAKFDMTYVSVEGSGASQRATRSLSLKIRQRRVR